MKLKSKIGLIVLLFSAAVHAQVLSLRSVVDSGVTNYGIIKAKNRFAQSQQAVVDLAKLEYLPNLVVSAQQSYGTINGQNGPAYGFGGYGVASSGLPLPEQNWNAAFGALYLVNVNWEFFTFGRIRQRIEVAKADEDRYRKDYEQELFQHKIRISAAYLNLLAAQRLLITQEKNLERANVFQKIASEKVKNGLLPGVDLTQANAEVSRSVIALNQSREVVKQRNNLLLELIGTGIIDVLSDTNLISRKPLNFNSADDADKNPLLVYYKSRIGFSDQQHKLYRKEYYPSVSLFGVLQTRASGFTSNYTVDRTAFTRDYFSGINPSRENYLLGAGIFWNATSIPRVNKKVAAQKLISEALTEEYKQAKQRLATQLDLADTQIKLALDNYDEAPKQVAAASQAYQQKLALYNNGLSDLLQVTQAMYVLNRAESDRDVIAVNVWQALLLKAAASGNFELFLMNLPQ